MTGAALRHLHTVPLQDWSVESLARRVGVSRTVLAGRFKRFLDQPPMQYLAHWRLQLAAQALKTSDLPMKIIADQADYESEQVFSRAFKRHFGLPPRGLAATTELNADGMRYKAIRSIKVRAKIKIDCGTFLSQKLDRI